MNQTPGYKVYSVDLADYAFTDIGTQEARVEGQVVRKEGVVQFVQDIAFYFWIKGGIREETGE